MPGHIDIALAINDWRGEARKLILPRYYRLISTSDKDAGREIVVAPGARLEIELDVDVLAELPGGLDVQVALDRWVEDRTELLPAMIGDLLAAGTDLLVTVGSAATLARSPLRVVRCTTPPASGALGVPSTCRPSWLKSTLMRSHPGEATNARRMRAISGVRPGTRPRSGFEFTICPENERAGLNRECTRPSASIARRSESTQ